MKALLRILFGFIPLLIICFLLELFVEVVLDTLPAFPCTCFETINQETNSISEFDSEPETTIGAIGVATSVVTSCPNIPKLDNSKRISKVIILLFEVLLSSVSVLICNSLF